MIIEIKNSSVKFLSKQSHTYGENLFANATPAASAGNIFDFSGAVDGAAIYGNGAVGVSDASSLSAIIPVSAGDVFVYSGTATSGFPINIAGYNSTARTVSGGKVADILRAATAPQENVEITITQEMVNSGVVAIRAWGLTSSNPSIKKQLD